MYFLVLAVLYYIISYSLVSLVCTSRYKWFHGFSCVYKYGVLVVTVKSVCC